MIILKRTTSDNPHFNQLINELNLDLNIRYGEIQKQYNSLNKVENLQTVVLAYYNNDPVGCGCFKIFDEQSVEIKRFYLIPTMRGQGIANQILTELEYWAKELGFSKSLLETGIKQHEAIRFYSKNGFTKMENFGNYIGNNNSMCFMKTL
jgi:putative acetyltransferase